MNLTTAKFCHLPYGEVLNLQIFFTYQFPRNTDMLKKVLDKKNRKIRHNSLIFYVLV